jgi:hypothetical protein
MHKSVAGSDIDIEAAHGIRGLNKDTDSKGLTDNKRS